MLIINKSGLMYRDAAEKQIEIVHSILRGDADPVYTKNIDIVPDYLHAIGNNIEFAKKLGFHTSGIELSYGLLKIRYEMSRK
jgi:hypothetical protein